MDPAISERRAPPVKSFITRSNSWQEIGLSSLNPLDFRDSYSIFPLRLLSLGLGVCMVDAVWQLGSVSFLSKEGDWRGISYWLGRQVEWKVGWGASWQVDWTVVKLGLEQELIGFERLAITGSAISGGQLLSGRSMLSGLWTICLVTGRQTIFWYTRSTGTISTLLYSVTLGTICTVVSTAMQFTTFLGTWIVQTLFTSSYSM